MTKSIGIDLGTTNSVAAIKKVRAEVLENAEGDLITPSCVVLRPRKTFLSKRGFVVGKDALEWMKQDPAGTVTAVKRLMGRNFQDEEIQRILSEGRLRYRIARHSRGTENSLAVVLNGKEFTPEELSAEILKKVRRDSEKALGGEVGYAVITVPAYFNDKQKHATRTAAALAGLKVRRLLPEPTAAAVSFGVDKVKGEDAKTVLVFDFGGGTLDLSVLTMSGGQFIEQGKGGNMWLGGEDIDRTLSEHVLGETARKCGIDDMARLIEGQDEKRKNRFLGELKAEVERAKIRLSAEDKAAVEIIGLLRGADGKTVDVDLELTRDRFEEIIAPVVQAALGHVRRLIERIRFTPDLIDNVLMVGGSSMIPSLVRALKREFGEGRVLNHERPMLAVAEGAAILSHRLSDSYECPGCGAAVSQSDAACKGCGFDLERHVIEHGVLDIVHAAAHDYSIRLEDGSMHLFVEKNTPLPCERKESFRLVHPEQRLVHMKFFNRVNDRDESIGDLWLGLDDPGEDEDSEARLNVEVTLRIDENNLVDVAAAVKERPKTAVSKTLSRGKADEKLFLALEETIEEVNREKVPPRVSIDLTHRSRSAIADIHGVVESGTDRVDEARYASAELKIGKARRMAKEGESSRSTIAYAEVALRSFGAAVPPDIQALIRGKVKRLKEMDERGTYEENVEAIQDLNGALNGKLGAVNHLMEIQKAGHYCEEVDPSKAPRFFHAIENILDAFREKDKGKIHSLLDEIMPEADKINHSFESEPSVVHKDIAK